MYLKDGYGKKYYCPFGCGTFDLRYELLFHLALDNKHSAD
jgi:hypothetical protein